MFFTNSLYIHTMKFVDSQAPGIKAFLIHSLA